MSIYWWFNAEVRINGGWKIPPELPSKHKQYGLDIGGEFGWMKEHWISTHLFFGANALFPFARGRPPGTSELCRLWDEYQPGWDSDSDKAVHWIDYERLYVGLWNDPTLLVQSYTSVRLAGLFGDGTLALPHVALLAAGATDDDFYWLHTRAAPASGPIDRVQGAGRGELEKMQAEQLAAVTWQTSIDWLLPSCAGNFRDLQRLGDSADLRVIAWRG